MNEVHARKDLEKVFEGFTPQDIDERKIILPQKSLVREVLDKYAELLEIPGFYRTDSNTAPNTPAGELNQPIDAISYILTPDEIHLFYQCAEAFEDHERSSYLMTPFLNKLMSIVTSLATTTFFSIQLIIIIIKGIRVSTNSSQHCFPTLTVRIISVVIII